MTLKITMTIDQESEQGLVLLGLLAKAYGRGEAGVDNLTIDRDDTTSGRHVEAWFQKQHPIRKATIAKLAAFIPKKDFRGGLGTILVLRGLKNGDMPNQLKAAWAANGLSKNGVGATLSKLAYRGLVKRIGVGVWKLTPLGEAMEATLESGTRDDGSQPKAE